MKKNLNCRMLTALLSMLFMVNCFVFPLSAAAGENLEYRVRNGDRVLNLAMQSNMSASFGGLVVNGEYVPATGMTESEELDVIKVLECALDPAFFEYGDEMEITSFGNHVRYFSRIEPKTENQKRIVELAKLILQQDRFKSSEDYIAEADVDFKDVLEHEWFYGNVIAMASKDYIKGKSAEYFCPRDTITRAEYIAILTRILYPENDFNAERGEAWWQKHYDIAARYSLLHQDDIEKDPESPITREEMAYITYNAICQITNEPPRKKPTEEVKDFNDIERKYKYNVIMAYNAELITGDEKACFNPKSNLTRAEAAAVLYRLWDRTKKGKFVHLTKDIPFYIDYNF